MSSTLPLIENPFKGLRPFEQDDEARLFGRERDLILFKERVLSSRTTLLFAGSGVGKTSFLNAKVIPELAKRYCVIWHNRWTGTDEGAENWEDSSTFKFWPPQDFGKSVIESLFGAWRRRRLALSKVTPKEQKDVVQGKLAGDVQDAITRSLKPGNEKRLSDVLSVFRKEAKGEIADEIRKKGCMLILDQFEEVFQYHVFEDYFDAFIDDLCKIINDDEYQVRVVFSMREEFLGELTAFDNRIPDLFGNYYRLRYPKIDEARRIITETCRLVKVEPHPGNLENLVKDLSSIEKNFDAGSSSNGSAVKTVRFVRRDYVPPPYLQIVCDNLWKEQYENPATAATNGGTSIQIKRFLEHYKSASADPAESVESDAQRAVRQFCEAKLSLPFLRKWEQNIAARAFGFLVTKQGAKMAYELRSLAAHMEERAWAVKHVLEKLSDPDARILRESRGPEGSYWFELYHDMYAGVVDRWKRKFAKEQRRVQQTQLLVISAAVAAMILIPFAIVTWGIRPRNQQAKISEYVKNLHTTDLRSDKGFDDVFKAYSDLADTFGYKGTAHSLWAQVWERRAQLFEANEQREEALLSLLQAAALTADDAAKNNYLAQANNLLFGNEAALKRTLCTNCDLVTVSPDARYAVTKTKEGVFSVSNLKEEKTYAPFCTGCEETVFSADGNLVAAIRIVTEQPDKKNAGVKGRPYAEAAAGASPSPDPTGWEVKISPSDPGSGLQPASLMMNKPDSLGQTPASPQRRVDPLSDSTSGFQLLAVSKTEDQYLIAGIMDQKLSIWRHDGWKIFSTEVKPPDDFFESPSIIFSTNGKFFASFGGGLPMRVWQISNSGLAPVTKVDALLRSASLLGFSANSETLLIKSGNSIKLWQLDGKSAVWSIDWPNTIGSVGFAPSSNKFVVADNTGAVTVWDSVTKTQLYSPLKLKPTPTLVFFPEDDGKSLIASRTNFSFDSLTRWSLDKGTNTGELELADPVDGFSGNSDLLLSGAKGAVRVWGILPPRPNKSGAFIDEEATYGGLTPDATSMVVLQDDPTPKFTRLRVLDLIHQKERFAFRAQLESRIIYRLSPDGNHLAVRTAAREVSLVSNGSPDKPRKFELDENVSQIVFSPDSKWMAIRARSKNTLLIEVTTGAGKVLSSEVNGPYSTFTPDNQFLVVSSAGSLVSDFESDIAGTPPVEFWSLSQGQKVDVSSVQKDAALAIAVSNDRVAILQGQMISVFDVKNKKLCSFAYPSQLKSLWMTEDGKSLITSDSEGLVQSWNAASGQPGPTVKLGQPIQKILFEPDGKSFIAVTETWLHRIEGIDNNSLRYSRGIFVGQIDFGSPRLSTANTGQTSAPLLSWVRTRLHGPEVHSTYFSGKTRDSLLQGDANTLLKDWATKLNFDVRADGYLVDRSAGSNNSGSY